MAEMPPIFTTAERRDEFIDKLNALIDEYPEIGTKMSRAYEEDPSDTFWTDRYGEEFDPTSPTYRTGIVLIIGHHNLQGWGDITFIEPDPQVRALSIGLIEQARDLM
jgi:hypothetical protein